MPEEPGMLTHQQAISFYNHLGAKQDWQAFFEERAIHEMITHASFENAQAVFEFGCGTGATASQVLAHHLPGEARYLAVDSSATMVRLAQSRLERFGARVTVRQTDGSLHFTEESGSFDRFVSTYVLDLLSASDIAHLLSEAYRLLVPNGRVCLVSLTRGSTRFSHLVTWTWARLHALSPWLVGGCRPLELRDCLPGTGLHPDFMQVVTHFGVPSEVVVASKQSDEERLRAEEERN